MRAVTKIAPITLLAALLLVGVRGGLASNHVVPIPETYASEPGAAAAGTQTWTPAMAALGKRLFYEQRLSRDSSVSCATCHDPARAFTDGLPRAKGVGGRLGGRNTPTIVNRGIGKVQFWDGRSPTLEHQALGPIVADVEMDLPIDEAVSRLAQDASYRQSFQVVFGAAPTAERLGQAIAAYEKTIYSVDSPFDKFLAGDEAALGEDARRGLLLFGAKARCGECHLGPNFSDELFHTLGLAGDAGRRGVTKAPADEAAFKTPTLREIEKTAPYMHDGSLATLEDVVDYYDRGGTPHPNLSPKMTKLGLTPQERLDLVAFLRALSGTIVEAPASPGTQEVSTR